MGSLTLNLQQFTYLYQYFYKLKKIMDSSNSSDKVTISKIPIHHQKLKSKQLEERLIKKKITDVQFLQSFIHYSNEKQGHLKRVKSQDLRKKILIYNASLFVNKLLETENEKQRVQKRQEEIKKKLEICSNCSGYKIVCYCGKSMLLTTKKYQLRRKIYQFSKETEIGIQFQSLWRIGRFFFVIDIFLWLVTYFCHNNKRSYSQNNLSKFLI